MTPAPSVPAAVAVLTREQMTWLPRRNPFCRSCRHPPDPVGPRVPSYDPEFDCFCPCHDTPEEDDC